ncbi:MAG TPA: response regulator [Candidatus Cloacimonadota bacterium]|jgi:DNA-binding NtrC family response regulator|nr:response regulator [Candidatus Cloacimonadota bacterium]HPM00634.1 response regulator [Candidatus Cloacimonadota bacterium]
MEKLNTSIENILIIDENIEVYNELNQILLSFNIKTKIINNAISAIKEIEKEEYHCFFVAENLKSEKAYKIIDLIKCYYPYAIVVLIVENPSAEMIINYVKYGIDNVISKPFLWSSVESVITFYNY